MKRSLDEQIRDRANATRRRYVARVFGLPEEPEAKASTPADPAVLSRELVSAVAEAKRAAADVANLEAQHAELKAGKETSS